MADRELNVVTGAFGYTGKYITRRLLEMGKRVRTLTGHPGRTNPFGRQVEAFQFNFQRPDLLAQSLQGATTLYNTYWVRFPRGRVNYDTAVRNTMTLIQACVQAGLKRIVHVSICNPSPDSPLPYYRGKALLEQAVRESGLSYAIIRPTVIFGPEDVLINNIAWLVRRFPLFAVPGRGDYWLQPVFVEDMASLAVSAGESSESLVLDAAGPEIFTFSQLVGVIAGSVGSRANLIQLNPRLALFLSGLVGLLVRDVVLTGDEVRGLMSGLLVSRETPTGKTRLTDWLKSNSATVGVRYASELGRHYR